jgi:hypothetical protein
MNDGDTTDDQIVESGVIDEISDPDLEAAAGIPFGSVPTLLLGTYCFACPPVVRERQTYSTGQVLVVDGGAVPV